MKIKNESKIISTTTVSDNIINAVNQYISDILSNEFTDASVIEITSIKTDLKNNSVYITYNDYSELALKAQELISKALTIQKAINDEKASTSPDETKIAILQGELSNLDNEYYEITSKMGTPTRIFEVI